MRSISILLLVIGCMLCECRAVAGEPYNFRESEAYRKLSADDRGKLEQVHRDFMTLWGAVDRYADNHEGKLPETLDKLVPNYLSELPTDPFATSETAKEKESRYYTTSKNGRGYHYRIGSPSYRAWIFSSVGLHDFPYLAEHGNIGLYVGKGAWVPDLDVPFNLNPSPGISGSLNLTRAQPSIASGSNPAPPSLDFLPAKARELISQYESDKKPIQKEAQRKIRKLLMPLIESLKRMQDDYTKEAKLDEAVAIRNWVRYLQQLADNVLPNPGTLQNYNSQIGNEFYFLVTGSANGAIWGTDAYTTDSALSAVAVHAGIIKSGETGVVKVTILPGQRILPRIDTKRRQQQCVAILSGQFQG